MYPNLRAEMVRQGITNSKLASVLNVDVSTVSAKINNYDRLKFSEAKKIQTVLFPTLTVDYLFATEPA